MEQGNIPPEAAQPIPAPEPWDDGQSKAAGSGKRSLLVQKFVEGEPKILGIVLLVLGLSFLACNVPMYLTKATISGRSGAGWWSGALCIISGVLSIVAEVQPTVKMLRTCLALNIITAVSVSIASLMYVGDSEGHLHCAHWHCSEPEWNFLTMIATFAVFLMLLNILAVTISIVLAVYARKGLRALSFHNVAVVVCSPVAEREPAGVGRTTD
uniref:membrane-spanning 4-domains subfamily A member 4A-like n=1 Tax=Pristiophorus japonicus TaxID=55135 RepID=UPI00398E3E29